MEYVITRFSDSNELMHYGVKGVKWGVMRAQKKQQRMERKAAKKEFKKDLKKYNDAKGIIDFEYNNRGEIRNPRHRAATVLSEIKQQKGSKYVDKLLKTDMRNQRIATGSIVGGSLLATAGLAYLEAKYGM